MTEQPTLVSVLDNGGETYDRYTITIDEPDLGWQMYGANENPFHPMGFGQFVGDGGFPDTDENPEIGLPIDFESLPEATQRYINQLLED